MGTTQTSSQNITHTMKFQLFTLAAAVGVSLSSPIPQGILDKAFNAIKNGIEPAKDMAVKVVKGVESGRESIGEQKTGLQEKLDGNDGLWRFINLDVGNVLKKVDEKFGVSKYVGVGLDTVLEAYKEPEKRFRDKTVKKKVWEPIVKTQIDNLESSEGFNKLTKDKFPFEGFRTLVKKVGNGEFKTLG